MRERLLNSLAVSAPDINFDDGLESACHPTALTAFFMEYRKIILFISITGRRPVQGADALLMRSHWPDRPPIAAAIGQQSSRPRSRLVMRLLRQAATVRRPGRYPGNFSSKSLS